MKTLLLALLPCFALAQTPITFQMADVATLPRERNFHGISGMEWHPAQQAWHLTADRGRYHVLRPGDAITGWSCAPDSAFDGGLYFEALRYDAPTDTYYFAVENDEESYVGFRRHVPPRAGEPFERLPLPHAMPAPSTNKGVEALVLAGNYLWVIPEAGSAEEARPENTLVHFYRYVRAGDGFRFESEFAYEIDRNICSSEALGGISEVVAMPEDATRLLVLERCYQRPSVTAKLYEARIDEATKRIVKLKDKPAFDFNAERGFYPDNLEAMCWSPDGRTLWVISDDNGGKHQWTQVVKLVLTN